MVAWDKTFWKIKKVMAANSRLMRDTATWGWQGLSYPL